MDAILRANLCPSQSGYMFAATAFARRISAKREASETDFLEKPYSSCPDVRERRRVLWWLGELNVDNKECHCLESRAKRRNSTRVDRSCREAQLQVAVR
jgi:hypothetical protein